MGLSQALSRGMMLFLGEGYDSPQPLSGIFFFSEGVGDVFFFWRAGKVIGMLPRKKSAQQPLGAMSRIIKIRHAWYPKHPRITLPETNIAPKNDGSQWESPFPVGYFQVPC